MNALTHSSYDSKNHKKNYQRLEFLRVLRNFGTEPIDSTGNLIINKSLKSVSDDQNTEANGN